ncbi:MAG: hypothetical protein U0894_13450, partial [Pirellulales bacterium]
LRAPSTPEDSGTSGKKQGGNPRARWHEGPQSSKEAKTADNETLYLGGGGGAMQGIFRRATFAPRGKTLPFHESPLMSSWQFESLRQVRDGGIFSGPQELNICHLPKLFCKPDNQGWGIVARLPFSDSFVLWSLLDK